MTRLEFEDTLSVLLALPRLDIQKLLPIDGRVGTWQTSLTCSFGDGKIS
jgi:hypothetical protein